MQKEPRDANGKRPDRGRRGDRTTVGSGCGCDDQRFLLLRRKTRAVRNKTSSIVDVVVLSGARRRAIQNSFRCRRIIRSFRYG